jgi:hypothetical protein
MNSAYWHIKHGYFVFPDYLKNINSAPGRSIEEALKNSDTELQIFLRGSLLENEIPFIRADADLFVLYTYSSQLNELTGLLPQNDFYDIKIIPQARLCNDFVFNALLNCRSLQISGNKFNRKPIKADKEFAWEHWKKYCPAIIPNRIDTNNNSALIHFKLLTRCFGVLSFLQKRSFTRDVSECIAIAQREDNSKSDILTEMRGCLECKKTKTFYVADIKKLLIEKFDEYYNCW